MTKRLSDLDVQIFADGADISGMASLAKATWIRGFTTNPTLMRKAGVDDYREFALRVLDIVDERPVSFEVFADAFSEMEDQAFEISSWGKKVFVKIPVTNSRGDSSGSVLRNLSAAGVQINVTAVMTLNQVKEALENLRPDIASYVSVFAGRISDTGCDPIPLMKQTLEMMLHHGASELIWASPRELLNVFQADSIGCHAITVTSDLLNKIELIGKDLQEYSRETVEMFYRDAVKANYRIHASETSPSSVVSR